MVLGALHGSFGAEGAAQIGEKLKEAAAAKKSQQVASFMETTVKAVRRLYKTIGYAVLSAGKHHNDEQQHLLRVGGAKMGTGGSGGGKKKDGEKDAGGDGGDSDTVVMDDILKEMDWDKLYEERGSDEVVLEESLPGAGSSSSGSSKATATTKKRNDELESWLDQVMATAAVPKPSSGAGGQPATAPMEPSALIGSDKRSTDLCMIQLLGPVTLSASRFVDLKTQTQAKALSSTVDAINPDSGGLVSNVGGGGSSNPVFS